VVSPDEITELMAVATSSGFSRKGVGLEVRGDWRYYLVPYLQEPSPQPCWMCVVVAAKDATRMADAERPEPRYSRLDVAIEEFQGLPDAAVAERDQLLHWVLWDATKSAGGREVSDHG
jgi:hypothetical protein